MNIVTRAAAAERLEWDYTYETRLLTIGSIDGGVLNGDLLVLGSGDPSIVERDGVASRLFDSWADTLKAAGVRTIDGRIIGDDNAFDDDGLGAGWAWDDLDKGFATPVGALQFNENSARLTIAPGSTPGSPTDVTVAPDGTGLVIHNQVTTAAAGTTPAVESRRLPGSARLELRGSIPIDGGPASRPVSVDNPTLFFVTALRTALMAHGIDVRGPAVDVDDVTDAASRAASVPVASHRSSTLATLATTLMKASQNLYAETLLKTVGASVGTPTIKAGTATARTALLAWHVEPSGLIQVDGSGLSRYNYVTPEALVTILTHVDRDDRLRAPFEAALPVAGRDGTLANRMQGTPAEANARAKTGTLANVRALAGYVATSDGEPLVFSILANNFETDPDAVVRTIDGLVVRLARFRR
jgi:D-alanyl-D-alanine carboxypeptidase/D-alanyl-D-alanine-endopeptidase (penicillin-binding protein 4)